MVLIFLIVGGGGRIFSVFYFGQSAACCILVLNFYFGKLSGYLCCLAGLAYLLGIFLGLLLEGVLVVLLARG